MSRKTTISYKEKFGNFHLYVEGVFDSETAIRSASLIARKHNGGGNAFVHMRKVTGVTDNAKETFESLVVFFKAPKNTIYFLGCLGFDVCHNGGRVIISKKEKKIMEETRNAADSGQTQVR